MPKSKTPDGLADAGRELWNDVAGKYELRPDERVVLTKACETADMIAVLDKAWSDLGKPFLTKGSMGQDVIHPLIGERRTQTASLAKLLAQLKLPDEAGGERPNQQRDAAQSRWAQHGKGA